MKKVFHRNMHPAAVPVCVTEPIPVASTHCSFSEIEEVVSELLKNLSPFQGSYSLHVEFTEPNMNPRFKLGYISCLISIFAETEDLRKKMLVALGHWKRNGALRIKADTDRRIEDAEPGMLRPGAILYAHIGCHESRAFYGWPSHPIYTIRSWP